MKNRRIAAFAVSALIASLAIVLLAHPRPSSFWGPTFFAIPYTFAIVFVPFTVTALASIFTARILRDDPAFNRHFRLGIAVGGLTFFSYGIAHAIAVAVFTFDIPYAITLLWSIFLFGGIFIFPIIFIICTAVAFISYKLFCSKGAAHAAISA